MQINELLLKNFGKFHDRQIDLDEGINLIHGENESGKSTIHTFIRGMLFGIERGRGRAAQNDTFSIYEPWENPNSKVERNISVSKEILINILKKRN